MLQKPDPGISATPHEDNLRYFNVVISGPQDSAYESMLIYVSLTKLVSFIIVSGLRIQNLMFKFVQMEFINWSFSFLRNTQCVRLKSVS